MSLLLKDANIFADGTFFPLSDIKSDISGNCFITADLLLDNGKITISDCCDLSADIIVNCENKYIFPGFTDVHVHFRQPGFSYKETIRTGSLSASHGGYTHVFTMPNLKPCPDSILNLSAETDIIKKDAVIDVEPFGSITKGEKGESLSDMEDMAPYVCGFSDDGKGIISDNLMKEALIKAKKLGKTISCHCEYNIPDSRKAEWKMIERDIKLNSDIGAKYNVCHISTPESVELIRDAKKNGVNITCETAPHYLCLCSQDIKDDGRYKMNPPLRDKKDRDALIEGLIDGTIDMIATDHAPHSQEEKSKGFEKSLNGIVGLETAFSVLYTKLVKTGIITLGKLISFLTVNPRKRFGLTNENNFSYADFTVFDLDKRFIVNSDEFLSMGRSTPFEGWDLYGKCVFTSYKDRIFNYGMI